MNLLLFAILTIQDAIQPIDKANPVVKLYGKDTIFQAYPDLSDQEVEELLTETWSRSRCYMPFVQFSEKPYTGKYVNVSQAGYRISKEQRPWPPLKEDLVIFVFGGSTTFGYGLPDEQTISSYLQQSLASTTQQSVAVYNFGCGSYYSTQERIRFAQLLTSEHVPDIAVFIDGLNEFLYAIDEPGYSTLLREFVAGQTPTLQEEWFKRLPMMQAVARIQENKKEEAQDHTRFVYTEESRKYVLMMLSRYLDNQKLIQAMGEAFNVRMLFVWQPIPMYKYDTKYHPFLKTEDWDVVLAEYGYEELSQKKDQLELNSSFFWCADMQQNLNELLYVDQVHYNSRMSQLLADTIANRIISLEYIHP